MSKSNPIIIGASNFLARAVASQLAQAMLPSVVTERSPRWEIGGTAGRNSNRIGYGCPGARKLRAKRKIKKKMRQQSRKKK